MIPAFDENGYLPPGIHPATLEEIEDRFGRSSELRRVQMDSIRWMLDLARRAGERRVILNGSFVTDIIEPEDVDCVILAADPPVDLQAEEELQEGLPFMDVLLVGPEVFDDFAHRFFAFDRDRSAKGMIEVLR